MSVGPALDPGPLAAEDWEAFLSEHLARRVRVSYGSSRTNPLLARRPRRSALLRRAASARSRAKDEGIDWHVRMHAMFASAPPRIRTAVADLLRPGASPRRARPVLESWIEGMLASLPPRVVPESKLATRGSCHDLARIAGDLVAAELRADFGPDRAVPKLTWGRSGGRRSRRGMRLGSYDAELDLVRIHPALDQPAVPPWFVRYVMFHELLHAELNEICAGTKRAQHHGREFRRREAAYPGTAPALDWQVANLSALIRSARTGKPMAARRRSRAARLTQALLFG